MQILARPIYLREWHELTLRVGYDSTVNHSVCKDKEACTLRMPAGGRKRARPQGGYARLARGS